MIKIITCFGPGGWEKYARKFVSTFVEFWPKDVQLAVYYHDVDLSKISDIQHDPRISYVDLVQNDTELGDFRKKCTTPNTKGQSPEGYNFRYDALKFAHKVFAISHRTAELHEQNYKGWLLWLDADTFTTKEVDHDWLKSLLPAEADIVHLPRAMVPYSETSFVGFNLNRAKAKIFLADLRNLYVDGELFNYREWHDGWLFSRLLYIHNYNGVAVHSLTPKGYQGLEAFDNSPTGERMVHLKGARKDEPKTKDGKGLRPLRITPVDSMPAEHIQKSAETSAKLFKRWLKRCKPHDGEVLICSAGDSIKKHLADIKKRQAKGAYVLCVKHTLPILHKAGIVPNGCVVLDPRNIKDKSTHGIVRTTLFDHLSPKTTFFVATMTDTSVVRFLMQKTPKVVGWVAWTQALAKAKIPEGRMVLTGGTCAAWRSIHLAEMLGFRKMRLYGFDFVVDEKKIDKTQKDDKGRAKFLKIYLGEKKKKEWTTGELCAGIQDVEQMFKRCRHVGLQIEMIGDRGAAWLWNQIVETEQKLVSKAPKIKLSDFKKEYLR
jgi:uncharacterized Rossmann fold enzyme